MSLITFLSDFGQKDHYVAAVKASILSTNPALRVVDISHEIPNCNIVDASFVLSAAFRHFPKGTVHIAAVGSDTVEEHQDLALQLEGHFFIGPNNGLFSLISDQRPNITVSLDALSRAEETFTAKNKYGPAAAMLASGKSIHDLGSVCKDLSTLIRKQGIIRDRQIQGHIIHIDANGNLITNLYQDAFEQQKKRNEDRPFEIILGRERSSEIQNSYTDVEAGECFYLFNDQKLLEIGIRYGSAAQLLSASYDTAVCIQFK